jgi:hypothetical protein
MLVGAAMNVMRSIKKILIPAVWVLAFAYFLIDAFFVLLVRPIARWLDKLPVFLRIATWIQSLGAYPSLFLFIVPLIVLEPVKPLGLYWIGTGRQIGGVLVLIVGEVIKILVLERIFRITRPKLMSFRAFAWAYDQVTEFLSYLRSLHVWQSVRKWFEEIKAFVRLSTLAGR